MIHTKTISILILSYKKRSLSREGGGGRKIHTTSVSRVNPNPTNGEDGGVDIVRGIEASVGPDSINSKNSERLELVPYLGDLPRGLWTLSHVIVVPITLTRHAERTHPGCTKSLSPHAILPGFSYTHDYIV